MREATQSFLLFRNGSLGNTLAAIPAMRALRMRYPEARMTVVADSLGVELFTHCPWVQQIIRYDKRTIDRGLIAYFKLVSRLRSARPTHAVLFKRFFRNGLLSYLSGARMRVGFETQGSAPFLNLTTPYEEGVAVVDLNLRLAALLDAEPAGRQLEIWLSPDDELRASEFLAHSGVSEPFVAAHYGGYSTSPSFVPPQRFAETLRACVNATPVVFVTHAHGEKPLAESIAASGLSAFIAHDLPIRAVAALVKRAQFFFGFNSGPAHLCAAVGRPGLIFFKPHTEVHSEIVKWKPPSDRIHAVIPPATDDDALWRTFIADCSGLARRLSEREQHTSE